jgi:excinuclease ABC subunit B
VIADLEARMKEAAGNLEFEEAARLRDEVKRLRALEMAVEDDPTAKAPTSPSPLRGGSRAEGARGGGERAPASRGGKPGTRTIKSKSR